MLGLPKRLWRLLVELKEANPGARMGSKAYTPEDLAVHTARAGGQLPGAGMPRIYRGREVVYDANRRNGKTAAMPLQQLL